MKQILWPILGVAAFIIIVGLFVKKGPAGLGLPSSSPSSAVKTIKVADKEITVEIARTKEERMKGLSGRKSLANDAGMLFIFDQPNVFPSFWMKDMLIPLDIIWINDNAVIDIDKNIVAPVSGTPDDSLQIYTPGGPVDYVLEVNSGFSNENKVKVGDSVDLSKI